MLIFSKYVFMLFMLLPPLARGLYCKAGFVVSDVTSGFSLGCQGYNGGSPLTSPLQLLLHIQPAPEQVMMEIKI